MSSLPQALRFMHVVPPLPRLMHLTVAALALTGMLVIVLDPASAPRTLIPLLTLQLFAVSTGFAGYVRRGYYDLLITGGTGRVTVAAAQWMMAALPGALAWVGLASVEALVRWDWPTLLLPGAAAAMWVGSTLPWACTVALPRFSAAIGLSVAWLSVVMLGPRTVDALAAAVGDGSSPARLLHRAGDWLRTAHAATDIGTLLGDAAWIPTFATTVAMIGALLWVRHASFPLESGQ